MPGDLKVKEVKLNIDGKRVQAKEGSTIVEAAREAGIRIPTLCHHEGISPIGSCRLCSVEISGDGKSKVVPACTQPIEEGLTVKTTTERVLKIRRRLIDRLLTRAPEAQVVQDLANEYGIKKAKTQDTEQKCVSCDLCCLCVRVCDEIVGMKAIGKPDGEKGNMPFLQNPKACIACGACAYVCPTGEIQMEDVGDTRIIHRWGRQEEYKLKKCSVCGSYFAPEVQLEYFKKKANLPDDYFDVCPDCRK